MCISVFVYNSLTVWDAMVGNNIMNRDCQTGVCDLMENHLLRWKKSWGHQLFAFSNILLVIPPRSFRLHGPWGLLCVSSAFLTISWLERGWRPTQGCCSGEQSQSLGRRGGGLHTKTLFLPLWLWATSKRECQAQRNTFPLLKCSQEEVRKIFWCLWNHL